MLKMLEKNSAIIKVWLVVVMTLLFIITLPVFIVVLPFVAAYNLVEHIYKPKQTNSRVKKLDFDLGPDVFDKWFSNINWENPEGK